jgi:hypothetical protein
MNQRASRDIQAEIEETRTETSRTVDEIEARLSPSQIIDQVLWHLRSGGGRAVAEGAGEFASNLARTIRENPGPSLLIGTGLAWLALTSMRGRDRPGREDAAEFYDDESGHGRAPEAAARYGAPTGHDEQLARKPDPGPAGQHGADAFADRPAAATTPEPDRPRTPTVEAILASDPHKPFGAPR